jgi:hypothetical protein
LFLGDPLNARIAMIDTSGNIGTLVGGPTGENSQPDTRVAH